MAPNYSDAIAKGIQNWMDANKDRIFEIIEKRVNASMEGMARAINKKVESFFDDNREELMSAVAAAIVYVVKNKNLLPRDRENDKSPN